MVDARLDGQSSNSNLVPYSRNRNKLQSKVDVPCQEPCFARKTSEDSPWYAIYIPFFDISGSLFLYGQERSSKPSYNKLM